MRYSPLRAYLATVKEIKSTRKLQVSRTLAAENLGVSCVTSHNCLQNQQIRNKDVNMDTDMTGDMCII